MTKHFEYNFIDVTDMDFKLHFDQGIVDWINKHYPARNWVRAAPTFIKTNLLVDELDSSHYASIETIQLTDFISSADIFWDLTHENIKSLIRNIAEYMMKKTHQGTDIYLMSLHGELVRLGSETPEVDKHTDTNGQVVRKVAIKWSMKCYYQDILQDNKDA